MCGRYYFQFKKDSVSLFLQELVNKKYLRKFASDEIYPSNHALVLFHNGNSYDIDVMKWGIDLYKKSSIINARSETFRKKNFFSNISENLCLIPCNGFYEWKTNGRIKNKIYIYAKNQSTMYMAGIYNERKEFVILTQESKSILKGIHHRMPVLVVDNKKDDFFNGFLDFTNQEDNLCFENKAKEVILPCFSQVKFEL